MSGQRDRFVIEGDCWCPGDMTLTAMRVMGHTESCTQARAGWKANYQHLSELARRRALDEAAGRQMREAAAEILAAGGQQR